MMPFRTVQITRATVQLSCKMCFNSLPGSDPEARAQELSLEEIYRMFDEMAEAGCLWLQLTGGEVLMRPDFEQIYLYAKRKGFLIRLFTNGTMVTPRIADFLARHRPFAIEVSLYGATEQTYEAVTSIKGSYRKCLRGIRLVLERKLPLTLKTVAITLNYHEMPQLQTFCDELGIPFRYDPDINPRLDGDKSPLQYRLTPEQVVALDAQTPPRARELGEAICAEAAVMPRGQERPLFDCAAGETAFHIDPYGKMSVCIMTRHPDYDLRHGMFSEAWQEVFPAIRAQKRRREANEPATYRHCAGWAQLENHAGAQATVAHAALVARLRERRFAESDPARAASGLLSLVKPERKGL